MKTANPMILTAAAMLAATNLGHAQTTFTKITMDAAGNGARPAWMDYDGHGCQDLVVVKGVASSADSNVLARNTGNGTFSQITSGPS